VECVDLVTRPAEWLCRPCKVLSYSKIELVVPAHRTELFSESFSSAIGRTLENQVQIEDVIRRMNDTLNIDQSFTEAEVTRIMYEKAVVYDGYEAGWYLAGDMFERSEYW
jgi:predicted nucleic acid-binding Zn ribbon protein